MPAKWVETREIRLDELTPFPGNARRGDVPSIAESLVLNGQYRSVVVRDTGGALIILAGNHTTKGVRYLAKLTPAQLEDRYGGKLRKAVETAERHAADTAKAAEAARSSDVDEQDVADAELAATTAADAADNACEALTAIASWSGQDAIRSEVIQCTDAEARRINLADNRTAELGDYDPAALSDLIDSLDGDLDGTGWTEPDLAALLEDEDETPPEDETGETGEVERGELLALAGVTVGEPRHKVEPGQIWALGEHHRLAVADLFTGWPTWAPLLENDVTFLPYPTPLAPHSPDYGPLVMVQPEPFLAGHLLDKWEDITGQAPALVNEPAAAA